MSTGTSESTSKTLVPRGGEVARGPSIVSVEEAGVRRGQIGADRGAEGSRDNTGGECRNEVVRGAGR